MPTPYFEAWPKTPRWYRDIVVTEKIDGTNGGILVERFMFGEFAGTSVPKEATLVLGTELDDMGLPIHEFLVVAQSRKRVVTPTNDNAGFGKWVWDNAATLVDDLGTGRHFGEWWGQGIQRNYGMSEKRFSLFNTHKWDRQQFKTPQLGSVPILYQGPNEVIYRPGKWFGPGLRPVRAVYENPIENALQDLREFGSYAADGFMKPEGVCIYHSASNQVYKVTLDDDAKPKSLV